MNPVVWMVIDLDRCWGCRACEVACKQELGLGAGPRPMRVIDSGARQIGQTLQRDFVPTLCQHCDRPACQEACPTESLYREADGSIQIRKEACSGCGACAAACPYGMLAMDAEGLLPVKCTLCRERRAAGALPSCAQHCPGRAMTVVDGAELPAAVAGRHSWRIGRIVYVSDKWASLGEAMPQ